jgi:multiple antibiotic resistance protein
LDPFSAAVALFIVMNPIGNIPVFLGILSNFPIKRQRIILLRELIFALIILVTFSFGGKAILNFLDLDDNVLGVGGGILLFLIALGIIFPRYNGMEDEKTEPILVPIAIPLTAGPGSLATVMLWGHQMSSLMTISVIGVVWLCVTGILVGSTWLKHIVSDGIFMGVKKLGGFLLCLIATHMIVHYIILLIDSQKAL